MMAAIVVPLARRNIARMAHLASRANRCWLVPTPDWAAALGFEVCAVFFFGRPALCFAVGFARFDFFFFVAIRPSLVSMTASCAATDTNPANGRGATVALRRVTTSCQLSDNHHPRI